MLCLTYMDTVHLNVLGKGSDSAERRLAVLHS